VNDIRHQLSQAASDEGVPLRTDVPKLLERARADRRRHRTRSTAVVALPTAAVLAVGGTFGTSVLPSGSGSDGDRAADSSSTDASLSTNRGSQVDPGPPPTAENLYQVLVTADGWTFDGMENSQETGGSQYWTKDGQWLEVQWYPASLYDSYLEDRRHGTIEREVELLGQSGLEYTEKPASPSQPTDGQDVPLYTGKSLSAFAEGPAAVDSGHRVYTILPAVGDYFLMIDTYTTDKAAFEEVIGSLTRVDEATWEQVIDEATVTKAEGEAFLAEAKRDVPIPDGVEVTVDDLDLPQAPYHARVAFAGPVLCGWAELYVDGDEQALETLRGSRDWPVLQVMRPEGEYAEVVADSIEQLAGGTTDKGGPYTLELFKQAVGC
jgi:hypothetical protein